jgi:hypothetical protein
MAKKKHLRVTRKGSTVSAPKKGLMVRSAESTRMTGLRNLPVEKRQAAVTAMLRTAR